MPEAETSTDHFHWFPSTTVVQLVEEIEEYGGADRVHLEVRQHGEKMYLRIVGPDATGPDLNESRICPPICP